MFNYELNDIADGQKGKFQNTDIKVLDLILDQADIKLGSIYPNQTKVEIKKWCLPS